MATIYLLAQRIYISKYLFSDIRFYLFVVIFMYIENKAHKMNYNEQIYQKVSKYTPKGRL